MHGLSQCSNAENQTVAHGSHLGLDEKRSTQFCTSQHTKQALCVVHTGEALPNFENSKKGCNTNPHRKNNLAQAGPTNTPGLGNKTAQQKGGGGGLEWARFPIQNAPRCPTQGAPCTRMCHLVWPRRELMGPFAPNDRGFCGSKVRACRRRPERPPKGPKSAI